MTFTTEALLRARLSDDVIASLKGEDGELDEAIQEADETITAYTGVAPSQDNPKVLVGIAGDLVIWTLSGRSSGIEEAELERRKVRAENAIKTLELIRDGKIRLTANQAQTPIAPTVHSGHRRMGDI